MVVERSGQRSYERGQRRTSLRGDESITCGLRGQLSYRHRPGATGVLTGGGGDIGSGRRAVSGDQRGRAEDTERVVYSALIYKCVSGGGTTPRFKSMAIV